MGRERVMTLIAKCDRCDTTNDIWDGRIVGDAGCPAIGHVKLTGGDDGCHLCIECALHWARDAMIDGEKICDTD